MGKFEIGQYVRVLDNSGAPRDYVEGEVGIVEKLYHADMVRLAGKSAGMFERRFEPWVPKVGERVTANVTTRVNIERHWNEHFRRAEGDIINGALVVTSVAEKNTGSNIGLSNKEGRSFFFMPESTLRPADPAPTTLTIEAGKFYKTRDGRKVGPAKLTDWESGDWKWSLGQLWLFKGDGTSGGTDRTNDIIAEWVDEPKASNDNGATLGGIASLIGKPVAVQVAQPKFKVGDKLVLRNADGQVAQVGATAVVGAKGVYGGFVDVAWVRDSLSGTQMNGGYYHSCFELADTPTNPAIVCLIENGQPKPSTTPHVHADETKAGKEAARLAGVYKGKKFGVFVLTTTARQAAPVYKHEWQRQAAAGNKISAIKELRATNDLTLKGAKDAVEHWLETAA